MGVSHRTLAYYEDRLGQAFNAIRNPYIASYTDVQAYLNTIPPNERGLATRHASYRTLKTFYIWLYTVYDFPNPIRKMPAPILGKPIMPTLKLDEIKTIMNGQSVRNKAIVALALSSGLRLNELANVKIDDIDWSSERVRTMGKGRKEAYAPLQKFAQPFVRQWLNDSGIKSGSLFGLDYYGLQTTFKRLGKRYGLKTNPHVFRRSFAVLLRELGIDTLSIMQLGRWESPEMVQRYTRAFKFDDANKLLRQKMEALPNVLSI